MTILCLSSFFRLALLRASMPTLGVAGYSTEIWELPVQWNLQSETLPFPTEKQAVVNQNRITAQLQVTHANPQRNWGF